MLCTFFLLFQAAFAVGEPFQSASYDFASSQMTARVAAVGGVMLGERLTAPPIEAYTIHRKLSGAFVTAVKLGLKDAPCRRYFYTVAAAAGGEEFASEPPLPLSVAVSPTAANAQPQMSRVL